MTRIPQGARFVTMAKPTHLRTTTGRDLRSLLHVPQHDLQAQLAIRLERLGFPALRPALVQLLTVIGAGLAVSDTGVRLSDLVSQV